MKVSVIVSIFNATDILSTTLPTLLNQDYPAEDHEIILVNDCSTDGTENLITSEKWDGPFITLNHKVNQGRSATRNTGLREASGDILIFIDCDIEVERFISSTFASAVELLNNDDLQLGSSFIDFGFEKTSLGLFKNLALVNSITFPICINHITKDISKVCSLNLDESKNIINNICLLYTSDAADE